MAGVPDQYERITFEVGLLPPSINQLMRKHWSYRHNQKTLWTEELACMEQGNLAALRKMATSRQRVSVEITVHHKNSFDPDNLKSCAKIPLDALKGLDCLVDDSAKWIDLDVKEVVGGEVKTVFCIGLAVAAP